MDDSDIALLGVAHERLHAGLHRLLRGGTVSQYRDVALLESVTFDERGTHVLHVVDAPPKISTRYLVLVDSNQQRTLGHSILHIPPERRDRPVTGDGT